MFYHIIASGSAGNATIVHSENTTILIDLGISKKRLIEGLDEIHLNLENIDALLLTHGHTDHVSGVKFISPSKTYGLEGTVPPLGNVINLFKTFKIKDIEITPVITSHDAVSSCGFILKDKDTKLVYITDTGVLLNEDLQWILNPDYLILECNHDIQMLLKTNRPLECKQRILSDHGHLCNEDSAYACLDIIGDKTKEIVLAHISREANTPECALEAYRKIFKKRGVDFSKYKVQVANQFRSISGGKI